MKIDFYLDGKYLLLQQKQAKASKSKSKQKQAKAMDNKQIDKSLPVKRGRKPLFSLIEFIIPESIQYSLVVVSDHPKKKHTRRPPVPV